MVGAAGVAAEKLIFRAYAAIGRAVRSESLRGLFLGSLSSLAFVPLAGLLKC